MTPKQSTEPEIASDPQSLLEALVGAIGGPSEMLELLADYRLIVGALAEAKDARTVLPDMRCWWSRKRLLRMAMDLPDDKGRALLGR